MKYSQSEELLWLYRQRVLINAQIGGPLSGQSGKHMLAIGLSAFGPRSEHLHFSSSGCSRTGFDLSLAQQIGEDESFDLLPILADALEDAGCSDQDLLDHLRGPGPHVRGCWVVDALLCKM